MAADGYLDWTIGYKSVVSGGKRNVKMKERAVWISEGGGGEDYL
jgi:hypothetical protein